MIHPEFKHTLQETIGVASILNGIPNSQLTKVLQSGITRTKETRCK